MDAPPHTRSHTQQLYDYDCFDTSIVWYIRAGSFVQCLTDSLARSLAFALHGLCSMNVDSECRKTIVTSHTYTVPTIFLYSRVSLELVL